MHFDHQLHAIVGDHGSLQVAQEDEVAWKLAMLIEGECEGLGPSKAAEKFGFSKQRYFQLRQAYEQDGAQALASKMRGPKRNYRRTDEVVRQVIRHRFLDADASAEVIAQKLRQTGFAISTRSVERVIADYGLQKKNSIPVVLARNRLALSRRASAEIVRSRSLATLAVSSAVYASFWPIRSAATWPAYGSWWPSICA